MHRVDTVAGFVKANMPYGRGGSLGDQEAWDVAIFISSHERPQDPRFEGSIGQTRDKHHDEYCLYGRTPAELEAEAGKALANTKPGPLEGLSPVTTH